MPASRAQAHAAFVLGISAAAIIAIGVALWIAIVLYYPNLEDRAAFGNLFGGINTLFAGFGFAALVYTLLLQQRALEFQQQASTEQQVQIVEQNRRLERQQFESSFFQLLSLHHEIVARTTLSNNLKGHQAFEYLNGEMRNLANWATGQVPSGPAIERVRVAYAVLHERHRGALDHYFRNLYHIIKFVDEGAPESPRRYSAIVRAQLSAPELLLLMYNGASIHGEKFKSLIEKYALLEHLADETLTQPGDKSVYAPSAFSKEAVA